MVLLADTYVSCKIVSLFTYFKFCSFIVLRNSHAHTFKYYFRAIEIQQCNQDLHERQSVVPPALHCIKGDFHMSDCPTGGVVMTEGMKELGGPGCGTPG